ncbi:hypothetical protein CsSME_00003887 [Camellia sinensis var. sinensis]
MTTSMNPQVEDQMVLISQFYPGIYTQLVPQQGGGRRAREKVAVAEQQGRGSLATNKRTSLS